MASLSAKQINAKLEEIAVSVKKLDTDVQKSEKANKSRYKRLRSMLLDIQKEQNQLR